MGQTRRLSDQIVSQGPYARGLPHNLHADQGAPNIPISPFSPPPPASFQRAPAVCLSHRPSLNQVGERSPPCAQSTRWVLRVMADGLRGPVSI